MAAEDLVVVAVAVASVAVVEAAEVDLVVVSI